MRLQSVKDNLGERAGAIDDQFGFVSCSDHGRIAHALYMTLHAICVINPRVTFCGRRNIWWCSTEVGMLLFVAGAIFDVGMSLFLAGAIFGDVGVSLFVAGATFDDVGDSLFVAGATFGDVGASLFVASATFGDVGASFLTAGTTSQHLSPHHITSHHLSPFTSHLRWFFTSPPPTHHGNTTSHHQNATTRRNSRRLVHTKTSVWASRWLFAVCTCYRQSLSLAYSFSLLKLPPLACPALLVYWSRWREFSVEGICIAQWWAGKTSIWREKGLPVSSI